MLTWDSLKEAEVATGEYTETQRGGAGGGPSRHYHGLQQFGRLLTSVWGGFQDAEHAVETLRQAQRIFGNEHPNTALFMLTLAEIYESLSMKSDALKLLDGAELIYTKDSWEG